MAVIGNCILKLISLLSLTVFASPQEDDVDDVSHTQFPVPGAHSQHSAFAVLPWIEVG